MKNSSLVLGLEGLQKGLLYSWKRPHLFLLAITQCFHKRVLIPLDFFRWILKTFIPESAPIKNIQLKAQPPGLRVSAHMEVMENPLHVEASLRIRNIKLSQHEARVTIDIRDLSVDAPKESSMASMLSMIDLKKPGLLLEWLPSLPDFVVETGENEITLDIQKMATVQNKPILKKLLSALSYAFSVSEIRVGNQAMVIQWKSHVGGFLGAIRTLVPSSVRHPKHRLKGKALP